MSRSQKVILSLLAAAAAVLLAVAARADLSIDQALYAPANPFGIFMEGVCWWPLYLPFALLGAALTGERGGEKLAGLLLAGGTVSALCLMAGRTFFHRGWSSVTVYVVCAALACALLAVLFCCSRTGLGTRRRLALMAEIGILLCAADNVVVNLLKLLWQRPRFDDMTAAGSLDSFLPWYTPGGAGGSSFPSGHTAAACGILCLLLLPMLFRRFRRWGAGLTLGCYAYIAVSGFSRLVIGRHFLSDTVAAAVVVSLLFFVLIQLPAVRRRIVWAAQ